MEKTVAVIDIGMTNKKISVYDEGLRCLDAVSRRFGAILLGGMETHDFQAMEEWFLDALRDLGKRHAIDAIAVSAHGATMVAAGDDGRPCAPCVFYTHEPGDGFHERFHSMAGSRETLQEGTGTAPFGALLNQAKGVLFLKETFPAEFARARSLLFLPQYWGARLTGIPAAEGTSVGCHTYLWDWRADDYSSVVDALGIRTLLPPDQLRPWDVLGTLKPEIAARTGLGRDTIVTAGIHDSNASLLLHLVAGDSKGFILNSTGTWCVAMHPREAYGFLPGEIGKAVFFLRSPYGKPVKTAIFPGGMEYNAWIAALEEIEPGASDAPGDDAYRAVMEKRDAFILPGIVANTGLFPRSSPRLVLSGIPYPFGSIRRADIAAMIRPRIREARAALDISMAMQTLAAADASGGGTVAPLCTEGGFRANRAYNALCAALPGCRVRLTDVKEATSLGAALTGFAALEGKDPSGLADKVRMKYVEVAPMPGLGACGAYLKDWKRLAGG